MPVGGTRGCGSCRNPQTLVEVMPFAAINKFQPFNVAISSNVLLLLVRPLPAGSRGWGGTWGGGTTGTRA